MAAGLAMQQTFDPAQGLAVVAAYGFGALLVALWIIGCRDA